MSGTDDAVVRHYARRNLLENIRAGLVAAGVDPDNPSPADLKAVDEFHIGGAQATADLVSKLGADADTRVLDIGCGIGGTSRFVAGQAGCEVTGVDLTEEYVACATALSAAAGLGETTNYVVGSATALPFDDDSFDVALLIHVGMNIADKPAMMREARRVLRGGGTFAIYEVMRTGPGELEFPLPWADAPDTSFVEAPETYFEAAREAGFEVTSERSRRQFALEFFGRMQAQAAAAGPPPVGLHLLMGPSTGAKVANMVSNIQADRIAPVEMILQAAA